MKVFSAPTRRTVIESAHLRCALPMQHALLTHEDQKLLRVAAAARIAVVLLLALCASLWITPFDSSGGLALRPCSESRYKSCSEASAWERLALPFTQWDTIHFLAIARDGYVDEQKFAFLPGVPALLALAGRLPHALGLSEHAFLPSVAVLIVSMLASCLSWLTPLVLYRLSFRLTGSRSFSNISSPLYILPPAPAILSVPYTEPFYAFFTFTGMLYIFSKPPCLFKCAACFAIAGTFRANGILNIGFLAWRMIWQMHTIRLTELAKKSVQLFVLATFVAAPFLLHQAYAYKIFCVGDAKQARPWCQYKLPMVYSFVQDQYWNVGFLRYWTLQQLPNFLLAAPVLLMSTSASVSYYYQTWPDCLYRSLPFACGLAQDRRREKTNKAQSPFDRIQLLPFIHLHTILALLLLFASHVQIALRQAATNPVIFWYAAHLVQAKDIKAKWWVGYCLVWGAVSVILWTLFYPPA